jgi:hypothetical protein
MPERASEPAVEPVAGDFDFDTAQIHDVLRVTAKDGSFDYRSVLVDSRGRTFEVDIDRLEGEKTYAAFESMKRFPLANQVYRQIAMGLIDQALQEDSRENKSVSSPLAPAMSPSATKAVDDRDPFDDRDEPK